MKTLGHYRFNQPLEDLPLAMLNLRDFRLLANGVLRLTQHKMDHSG